MGSIKTQISHTGEVTADDVAREAGVSRWTVNRAFKEQASISSKSREKVMDAAERLGYVPNLLAAGLASNKTNLVALLVDDFANPHKLVMMECLTKALRKGNFDTLLINTLNKDDTSRALLSARQRRVDAAVLIGLRFDDEVITAAQAAESVKKLIIFARSSKNRNTISISCDDVSAMHSIAEYVLANGYQKPMFFAGPNTSSAHVTRKQTFVRYWLEKKDVDPEVFSVDAYDSKKAYITACEKLEGREKDALPDVIVCENDALAFGTIDAIKQKLGLRVPEDIAVTGFDDVPQANSPNYDLTTYRQPLDAMADRLVNLLRGEDEDLEHNVFEGKVIVRGSA